VRILIVEDEPTLGQQLKGTLEQSGYAVDLSTDGEDGHFLEVSRSSQRIWGFQPASALVSYPLGHSARLAAGDCWQVVSGTVSTVASLFGGHHQGQLTSTVGIVRISAAALKVSFTWYLQIVGLVSMSLALLNLLPLLPLDGGHILFSLIEAVRRRALAREVYERVSFVGFALILLIWVIALSNDVSGAAPR